MRIDLPGLGDSVVDEAGRENAPYVPDASAVMATALEAFSRHTGATSFVLAGLCSGAHTSFHAALDLERSPIVESVLINPLTFAYTPGMSLDVSAEPHAARSHRYWRSMGSVQGWLKLLRNDVGVATIARDVVARGRIVARHWRDAAGLRRDEHTNATARTDLGANLRRLVERRRKLTLVFSRFDPGYDLLMVEAGGIVKTQRKSGQVNVWFIEGANHTFDARKPRAEMVASLTSFLTKRYLGR